MPQGKAQSPVRAQGPLDRWTRKKLARRIAAVRKCGLCRLESPTDTSRNGNLRRPVGWCKSCGLSGHWGVWQLPSFGDHSRIASPP